MNTQEFADKLLEIAAGIDKLASEAAAAAPVKTAAQEKEAARVQSAEFGFGEISSKPEKGRDPLLDFCLSSR